ncbi:hypothetical protein TNCV_3653521 [Trichonephila clavipes]|nr:hypothetical protein TNCV_3653521 [Trichonephila clavipes]
MSTVRSLTRIVLLSTAKFKNRSVGSLVARASDSRPEGLGSNTLRCTHGIRARKISGSESLVCRNHECRGLENNSIPFSSMPKCEGGDRWCRHLSSLWEFLRAESYCDLHGA